MADRPIYGKKPNWSQLYRKHFPGNTDGASRHVKCISELLRDKRSTLRKAVAASGCDPDHMAESMETTVIALWECRAMAEKP